jgi:hypothetical protein
MGHDPAEGWANVMVYTEPSGAAIANAQGIVLGHSPCRIQVNTYGGKLREPFFLYAYPTGPGQYTQGMWFGPQFGGAPETPPVGVELFLYNNTNNTNPQR